MIPKGKISVYFHVNPSTELPFYVGIGIGFRPYRITGRSQLWNRVAKKYGVEIKIIHLLDTWEEAQISERDYIKMYGRIDNKTGILVNHTDGGDGTLGCIFNVGSKRTPEQRKKISDSLKGRKPSQSCVEARKVAGYKSYNKGKSWTPEMKSKMSEIKKGSKLTAEQKLKISAKMKGRFQNEEWRRKNSEALKGRKLSEEHKKKISLATKRQWAEGRCFK